MATVCAGTLSLMDAGVPIRKPVSGIAMGMIAEGDRLPEASLRRIGPNGPEDDL
mgnify:CR=1 FL=1